MSMPARRTAALLLAAALVAPLGTLAADKGEVALPKDFRTWTHVRSMVVTDPDEGMYGFHNVYANKAALAALRGQAKAYPDGAQFVVSIFEVKQEKGQVVAGQKQRDVVQVKDARAKETGGWRFASFDPSGKRTAVDVGTCHACHAQASDSDHVYTRYAE